MLSNEKLLEKRNSSNHLLLKLKHEVEHAQHVCKLSLRLFDQLKPIHGLGEEERCYLECAALLHDIGWVISGKGHHKQSMRMIINADLPSFTDREIRLIANIARYHRKSMPSPQHPCYKLLPEGDQRLVCILASFLRIADGLDDTHELRIHDIECINMNGEYTFKADSFEACTEEIQSVERKQDLFLQTFGKNFRLVLQESPQELSCIESAN